VRRLPPAPVSLTVLGGVLVVSALLIASAESLLGASAGLVMGLVCVGSTYYVTTALNRGGAGRVGGARGARGVGPSKPVDRAEWSGPDELQERAMLDSILDFGGTVAREVMVPRPEMVTVEAQFRADAVIEIMLLNGYSRLPACGGNIDDVVGLVYAKDLMRAERDGLQDRPVSEMLRPAVFVPETKRLPELLREMQQHQFHMAIVVDEYGGTAGLVTLEDIIEELVGEIVDEYDVEDPMIEPLPGGDALVRGRTSVAELNDLLQADLPEGDWDTVGGLLYSRLSHVPVEGETVEIGDWRLTAQRVQGRRISRVRLSRQSANDLGPAARSEPGTSNGTAGPHPTNGTRATDDAGVVGGIEAIPFGLLVFVLGALLIANAWSVIDAKLAVNAAAREATRRYVEAEVTSSAGGGAADRAATRAGMAALAAHGRDPGRAQVRLTGLASRSGAAGPVRCARVTYTATYQVPALALPWIGGLGDGFDVSARHSELVDPYRDGLPGDTSDAEDGVEAGGRPRPS
jgi:Mg2+/Co2+ transporter CorC